MTQLSLSEFADKLLKILPVVMRELSRGQADELYKGKITLPQLLALDFLIQKDESKMTDIAHFMHVTTAAITGIVDRLVRDGYVTRVYEPKDRRIIKVRPTSTGAELVKKIKAQRRKAIINVFGKITPAEREDYLGILLRIQDILTTGKEVNP